MIQTLVPAPVSATASAMGSGGKAARLGGALAYGLTPRALYLLLAGALWAVPAFFHPRFLSAMLAWDAMIGILIFIDAASLPAPRRLTIERRFENSLSLGQEARITLGVKHDARQVIDVTLTDELHVALAKMPRSVRVKAFPLDFARADIAVYPGQRGDFKLGKVFAHYRGTLRLAERWAVADLAQPVRVYAEMERGGDMSIYLARIRQIELQKRKLRLRGMGREFESHRDYQSGDELRNVSWTATARRAKLITRQFTTERSQQVWIVLDAGRLSRTSFTLSSRDAGTHVSALTPNAALEDTERRSTLNITQMDQAAAAATALAQVVMQSGDKVGLLAYGRRVQQRVLPGAGIGHLRILLEALAQIKSESAEADHIHAALQLRNHQRRRGLVLWITEMAETALRPEMVDAAAELARRHLVVLVLLQHPEMAALAAARPSTVSEMFAVTAAQEALDRRRLLLARLHSSGVLVVETTPSAVKASALNQYLEVKARGLL